MSRGLILPARKMKTIFFKDLLNHVSEALHCMLDKKDTDNITGLNFPICCGNHSIPE